MWIVIIAVVVIIALYFISTYNGLVGLRNKVKDQWAQVDVQLKRRFDLIPNLVETVKGYAKHESETLEDVVRLRNSFSSATTPEEEMKANKELSGAITKIFALAEAYPDLKANANFVQLQADLKDTEDKISYSRQFYNDNVMNYKNKIEMFPTNIVASLFKFNPEPFFEANDKEKENVQVKF